MFSFIDKKGEDSSTVEASTDVDNAADVDSLESHGFDDYYIPDESVSKAYVIAEGNNDV